MLDFYQSVNSQAFSASYAATEIAAVIKQHNNMKSKCAASFFIPIKDLFNILRPVVETIVKLSFYSSMAGINFLRLLLGQNSNEVMADVFRWINLFINEAKVLFDPDAQRSL